MEKKKRKQYIELGYIEPKSLLFELNQDNKRISSHTWIEILANQID